MTTELEMFLVRDVHPCIDVTTTEQEVVLFLAQPAFLAFADPKYSDMPQ